MRGATMGGRAFPRACDTGRAVDHRGAGAPQEELVQSLVCVIRYVCLCLQTIGALGCLKSGIGLMGSSEMSVVANA